jgi:haloalkane dehalogenase
MSTSALTSSRDNTPAAKLIIWSDGDFAFGDKELRRWQQTFADHETVIVKGAGHFVPSDAPDQFAAAIRRWYTRSGLQ